MRYPETRRDDTVERLHGQDVADPYRWLEDPDSPETRDWVVAQNRLSREHLDALPSRAWFTETMQRLLARPRAGAPDKVGGRYLVSRNDGTQQQDQWFVADSVEELVDGGHLLIDPNRFSEDGTSSLAGYNDSRDGRWLAYLVSDGGSDWTTIRVKDLHTGDDLDDVVTKVKFSEATWLPDGSYLYTYYPTEGAGVGTEAEALPGGRLRRHRVGEPQDRDDLVLEFPENPRLGITPQLSADGRWLAVEIHDGTSEKNRLWLYPVTTDDAACTLGDPLKLVDAPDAGYSMLRTDGDELYLLTDLEAPLGRVVRVDLEACRSTGTATFVDVVAERAEALHLAHAVGEEILTVHLVDAQPRITRYALDGTETGVVDIPGGEVVAVNGDVDDPEVFVGVSSLTERLAAYRLDLASGTVARLDLAAPDPTGWTPPDLVTERRRATSTDGTAVPYFLVRAADVSLDEPRPTLLYGYGGFHIPVLANFRAAFAGWLAAGGVLAVANLRGGSEYGAAWHDAGRLDRKQNVFDDFAAVAEHLVAQGVTTHDRLALHGGSNGGLLVGAVITQHPEIAAVALPAVGVMDMLRFHLFTIGGAWVSDYGSPEDPEQFATLLGYSPLHNIKEGTAYPATLVLTGDHDDRVVPAHSFKFTAELQRAQAGEAPVLARIETSTGHGLGKPVSVQVAETADLLAFAAEHTGLVPPG
jgi:prolyl oligopeptidase